MNVSIKCLAQLSKSEQCNYLKSTMHEVPEGSSVTDLIGQVGLREEEVKTIFLNHVIVPPETLLNHGDRIAFVPPTGGM